jgi:hypothetical protein
MQLLFLFLLSKNHSQYRIYCVICSHSGIFLPFWSRCRLCSAGFGPRVSMVHLPFYGLDLLL